MNNIFYIVRHGQTDWNVLGKTQGHGNSDLTEKGINQAKSLANSLKNENIDLIFSSNLKRAYDTAKIIGDTINLKVTETEALREMGFGVWEGLLVDEIKKNHKDTYKIWRETPHLVNIKGGETLQLIKERTDKFIDELNKKYENKKILIVSHSITVRVILLSFLNSDIRNIYRIKQDNTALNIVESRDYGPVVIKINDTNHINDYKEYRNSALE